MKLALKHVFLVNPLLPNAVELRAFCIKFMYWTMQVIWSRTMHSNFRMDQNYIVLMDELDCTHQIRLLFAKNFTIKKHIYFFKQNFF